MPPPSSGEETTAMVSFRDALARRWVWFASGGAVLLAAVGIWAAVASGILGGGPAPHADPAPQPRAAEAAATPKPDSEPAAEPTPVIDIPATQFMPYTPVWDPPDEGQNFWQVVDPANGYPEFGGTTYLLAHACYAGGCVGDEARALVAGDALTFRGDRYTVGEKLEITKSEIGDQAIWEHEEGRLVIITCIIDPSTGAIDENAILVASKA